MNRALVHGTSNPGLTPGRGTLEGLAKSAAPSLALPNAPVMQPADMGSSNLSLCEFESRLEHYLWMLEQADRPGLNPGAKA